MKETFFFIGNCIKSIITCFSEVNTDINDVFEKISLFLNKIIITRIANECSSSVIQFVVDLLSIKLTKDNQNSISLIPFIKTIEIFFKMQSFRYEILKNNTIEDIWTKFCENEIEQNILLPHVVEQMTKHTSFYADSKVRKLLLPFLTTINSLLPNLKGKKCDYVINFLVELSKQDLPTFIGIYSKLGILNSLMPKAFESNESENKILSTFILYSMSVPYIIQGKPSPPLFLILRIFGNEKSDTQIHHECLKFFLKILASIKNPKENPFQASEISTICASIPFDDYESIQFFCQFITILYRQFHIDILPVVPGLINFCKNYKIITETDLTPLLTIFNELKNNFSQFFSSLFIPLFENLNEQQVSNLFNKNPLLYSIISLHFGESMNQTECGSILGQFISSFPYFKDQKTAKITVKNIVLLRKGYKSLDSLFNGLEKTMILDPSNLGPSEDLFSLFIKFTIKSKTFSNECVLQKVSEKVISFYSKYKFSSKLILNFISAIADHKYIPLFDMEVNNQLKEQNYLNESGENILDLTLGLQIGEDRNKGNLCFPSLVWKCAQYEFKYQFDLCLCSIVSIDIWLKESNRPLSEFPSIASIARQYMNPWHLRLLLDYPKVIEEVCKSNLNDIPLFEFPPLRNDAHLSVPFPEMMGKVQKGRSGKDIYNNGPQAISFWFKFLQFTNGNSECQICSIGTARLTSNGNKLFFEGKNIGTIKLDCWNLIVITNTDESKDKTLIYLDNENVMNGSYKQIASILFGGKNSSSNWVIGGGIGLYSSPLKEDQIKSLAFTLKNYNIESFPIHQCIKLYTPYSIFPLFKQVDLNSIKSSRPSIVYSFYDYIKKCDRGTNPLFIKAVDMLHDKEYENTRSLIVAICSLHKKNLSFWSNKSFALNMSIICSFDTPIVDEELIKIIVNCLDDGTKFDWDNFFVFALDYRFFNTEIEPIIFGLIKKYYEIYPFDSKSPLNSIISDFLLSLIILPDFKQENRKSVYDLIHMFVKNPSKILRYIISTPDFADNLLDYSTPYEFKNSETVEILLAIYFSLTLTKFREYYVFSILERKQCLMILDHLINSKLDKFIDDTPVLEFCLMNVSLLQAWEIALALFLKKDITLKDLSENLNFSSFQMKYFENFLHMVTFLSFAAIRLPSDNLNFKLCCQVLRGLNELVDSIENPNSYLDLILILMTLGQKITSRSNFPLSPKIETDEEIIKCALSRGQAYPQHEPNEFTMPTIEYKITTSDIPNLTRFLPSVYCLSEKDEMPMDLRIKELSFVIMEKQYNSVGHDWNTALKALYEQFEITEELNNYENSQITHLIIQFLAKLIIKFPDTIETIMGANVYLSPELSIYWERQITLEILNECIKRNIYNYNILDYILKRTREGWYTTIFIKVMKGIFEIIKKKPENAMIPASFYHCIWTSLDIIVPDNKNISEMCHLLVENENIIMNCSIFDNFISIMSILYRGIALIPFLPSFMRQFWLHVVNKIKTSDIFLTKMKKEFQSIDLNAIIRGLSILGQHGIEAFNTYKVSNIKLWSPFDSALQSHWDKQRKTMSDTIKKNVDTFLNQLEKNGETFLNATRKLLINDILHRCKSKAIACSVRYYTRRMVLLMTEHYLRLREYIITKTFPFKDSQSKRYSLSILSDPIYPTRRLTLSPIEYKTPPYPNGSSDDLYNFVPTEEMKTFEGCQFPECVSQNICNCRVRGPSFLSRIRHPMLAKYITHVYNIPSTEYYILLSVFNFIPPQNIDMHQNLLLYQQQKEQQTQQQTQQNSSTNMSLTPTSSCSEQNSQTQLLLDNQPQIQLQQQQQQKMDWDQIMTIQLKTHQHLINETKENIIYICETSFLYGIDVLEGTAIFTNKCLYFFEGVTIRGNCLFQIHSNENMISQEFYIQSFQGGLFSSSVLTYRSHYVAILELNQIISVTNHLWIQRPYSMTLNFSCGYNFVLIFKKATYDDAYTLIKAGLDEFFDKAPQPVANVRSPLASARLILQKQSKSIQMWSDGDIDNYTYLCLVNRLAKRCFADLTQYPVFPWVISDYVSATMNSYSKSNLRDLTKPMGQIGEERAERFELVFNNSDPKYYYGTHYLHFGVVAYFMFRLDPYSIYSFILHHGWDHPHRIFFNIMETWNSAAYDTPSDVKELIPQMFKVPEILLNPSHIPLIAIQDEEGGEVKLPKWAANARYFTTQNSKVLELRLTTKYLPNWIDLIFGVNSRGPGAVATKNLFHPTCYPDLTELEDIEDLLQKQAIVTSIINFGQCSPQIFIKPHPHQNESLFSRYHLISKMGCIVFQKIKCTSQPISSVYLNHCEVAYVKDTSSSPYIVLPGTMAIIRSHDDHTLSHMAVSSDGLFICRTYLDGHVIITRVEYGKNSNVPQEVIIENFITELGVGRCAISSTHFIAFVACDKTILQFDIGTKRKLQSITLKYKVKHIVIDEDAAVVWVVGSQYISLYSISMSLIIEDMMKAEIVSICASPLPEHFENRFALIGHSDGTTSFIGFSYQTNKFTSFYRAKLADEPIISVAIDSAGQRALAATKNACYDFEYIGTKERPLNMKYAYQCASCLAKPKNLTFCQKCNRFTCPKCLSRDSASGLKVCNNCKTQMAQK